MHKLKTPRRWTVAGSTITIIITIIIIIINVIVDCCPLVRGSMLSAHTGVYGGLHFIDVYCVLVCASAQGYVCAICVLSCVSMYVAVSIPQCLLSVQVYFCLRLR